MAIMTRRQVAAGCNNFLSVALLCSSYIISTVGIDADFERMGARAVLCPNESFDEYLQHSSAPSAYLASFLNT